MTSAAFKHALEATGYLGPNGRPAPGLIPADDLRAAKMRAVFSDDRVGLNADAVFSAQNAPTSIFKDLNRQTKTSAGGTRPHGM